jgi:hypothetical protein
MQFSMTGPEKGDCLIEMTAWAGLTVSCIRSCQRSVQITCWIYIIFSSCKVNHFRVMVKTI